MTTNTSNHITLSLDGDMLDSVIIAVMKDNIRNIMCDIARIEMEEEFLGEEVLPDYKLEDLKYNRKMLKAHKRVLKYYGG